MKECVMLEDFQGEIVMPIPDSFLGELGLSAGANVDVRVENGRLVIEPLRDSIKSDVGPASGAAEASNIT